MDQGVAADQHQAKMPNVRSIYDLITANNLDEIRSLLNPLTLRHRQSIVCQIVSETSLLGHACELGLRDIAKYLLDECEADITDVYTSRCAITSPLQFSIKNLDLLMIIVLRRRGVVSAYAGEVQCCFFICVKRKYFAVASIVYNYMHTIESMEEISEYHSEIDSMDEISGDSNSVESMDETSEHSNLMESMNETSEHPDSIVPMDETSEYPNPDSIVPMEETSEYPNPDSIVPMEETSEHPNSDSIESMDETLRHSNSIQSIDKITEHPNLRHFKFRDLSDTADYLNSSMFGEIERMKYLRKFCDEPKTTTIYGENALCLTILHDQTNAEYFLLNYREFSVKDHVLALEMAGANFILLHSNFAKGLACWRKALKIRAETFFGVSDKFEDGPQTDLGFEFSSEEQLDLLQNHDTDIYVQALIVLLRFLPPENQFLQNAFVHVALKLLSNKHLMLAITILAEFDELANISYGNNSRSDMIMRILLPGNFSEVSTTTSDLFAKLNLAMHYINEVNWKELLERDKIFYPHVYTYILDCIVIKIIQLSDFHGINPGDHIWIKESISSILQCYSDPYPITLLHLLMEKSIPHHVLPFFISCSHDMHCRDEEGNTPMHTAVHFTECNDTALSMINMFADAGGHVDAVNDAGITPLMILRSRGIIKKPLKFLSLQCLTAQKIREHNIIVPEKYPKILVSFINIHR